MSITAILGIEDVILDLRAADKRRLLEDLARRCAARAGADPTAVFEALQARENLGSTGMGSGMAIPHARLPSLTRPAGLFARLRQPMDFDAIDGDRVDLVFLLLLPAQVSADPINTLACVARRLRDERVRGALRKARDAREAHAILCDEEPR